MIGASPSHPEAECGNLRAFEIDPGSPGAACGGETRRAEHPDRALFEQMHEVPHSEPGAPEIDECVCHELTGTVIGHLTAPIALHHRHIPGGQHVFPTPRLAEREDRGVLDQP